MDKVLLVDDEPLDLEGLKVLVPWEQFGMKVMAAVHSGFTALDYLNREKADILITDIKMPIMSGIEMAGKARELYPDLKIIFISGYQDFQYAKTAIQLHASSYILKPVVDSELFECLRQVQDRLNNDRIIKQMESTYSQTISLMKNEIMDKRLPGEADPNIVIPVCEGRKQTQQHPIINEIEQYVGKHLSEQIHLRQVARHFGFSPNHLGHLFKEAKHMNFSDFVTHMRIERAKQLLRDPKLKIYEVSEQAGYKKLSYFSHHFKAHVGLTPGEFRKQ